MNEKKQGFGDGSQERRRRERLERKKKYVLN